MTGTDNYTIYLVENTIQIGGKTVLRGKKHLPRSVLHFAINCGVAAREEYQRYRYVTEGPDRTTARNENRGWPHRKIDQMGVIMVT